MKKTIEQWERKKGCLVKDADLSEAMTEEEFDNIEPNRIVGVDWEHRLAFLKKCGYEVTRENIANPDLSYIEVKSV